MRHEILRKPCLIAITGLSGSGKSTLCRAFQQELKQQGVGTVHIASDIIRKDMFKVAHTERLPASAYEWSVTRKVIHKMHQQTNTALNHGKIVLYDALLDHKRARKDVAKIAIKAQVPFFGFWLSLPEELIKERITKRTIENTDASDATIDILEMQLNRQKDVQDWPHIDATQDHIACANQILEIITYHEK